MSALWAAGEAETAVPVRIDSGAARPMGVADDDARHPRQAPAGFAVADLAATMGEQTRSDGEYLWIAESAIRHWLSGLADDDWEESFAGMVSYARSKGWTDEASTHLRAHVENPG